MKNIKTDKKYSNHLSITKFIILNIITIGIYKIGWIIKNWLNLEDHTREEVTTWHYIGLFIPIVNIFILYSQFVKIKNSAKEKLLKVDWSPGWRTFWTWILMYYSGLVLEIDNLLYFFVIVLGIELIKLFPLLDIQDTLNEYWDKTQEKLPKRKNFSIGQWIWIIGGIILWIFILL